MKNLWKFLSRFSVFFVFLAFQFIAFWLMSQHTTMQRVRLVGFAIETVGAMHDVSSSWRDYFSLKQTNHDLSEENARLLAELERYKKWYHNTQSPDLSEVMRSVQEAQHDSTMMDANGDYLPSTFFSDSAQFSFVSARVVNNSFDRTNNFITINKGRNEGISEEMGIIGPDGVVGIITSVSSNYAVGPTLLNSRWSVSAKIKRTKYFGTLAWDGKNPQYAQLHEIPFHVQIHRGDTLLTSGYSDVFPEGIPVAVIDEVTHSDGANFLNVTAKLLTDFQNLSYVTVVANHDIAEIDSLINRRTHHE